MNHNNTTTTNHLLNVKQAAVFLGVNVGTIRRWARSKALTGLKIGIRGDWRFTEEDLLKLTKSNHNNRLSQKTRKVYTAYESQTKNK